MGANARFLIYKKLEEIKLRKDLLILVINSFASFSLGLFLSILSKISYTDFVNQLVLFFLIGFLGSLSTFSTFIYDLFDLSIKLKFFKALKLLMSSIAMGLISLLIGFLLAK